MSKILNIFVVVLLILNITGCQITGKETLPSQINLPVSENSNPILHDKSYIGTELDLYEGEIGSYNGKSIFQKRLSIEKDNNDVYKISILPSNLISNIYKELSLIPDDEISFEVSEIAESYNLEFALKKDFIDYLDLYISSISKEYEYTGLEEKDGKKIYKYKEKGTPYKVYREDNKEIYKSFDDLKKKHNEYKNIVCLSRCDISSSDVTSKFISMEDEDLKEYTLEELYSKDEKFKKIKENQIGGFIYEEEGRIRYNEKDLISKGKSIKEELLKEKEIRLNLLGEGVGLSYADYGYWEEESLLLKDEKEYKEVSLSYPLIGGVDSKRIEEKELKGEEVFKGGVIAHITSKEKEKKERVGEIEYRIKDKEKEFKAQFKDWYEIEIKSNGKQKAGEEGIDWKFKGDYEEGLKEGEGLIKEIRYYKEGERIESVGILEYTSDSNTNITLTYGAKNK